MTLKNKVWETLKAEYLGKVQKALSLVKHPQMSEVIEDVQSHMDQRFSELKSDERTNKNIENIIAEMGPASDYAELLAPDTAQPSRKNRKKILLLVSLAIVIIAGVVLLAIVWPPKAKEIEGVNITDRLPFRENPKKTSQVSFVTMTTQGVMLQFFPPSGSSGWIDTELYKYHKEMITTFSRPHSGKPVKIWLAVSLDPKRAGDYYLRYRIRTKGSMPKWRVLRQLVPVTSKELEKHYTKSQLSAHPLRKGLVAHWSAEGNANDSAGQNHGKLRNGATFAPGKIGQAFKLDGKDDYIDFCNPKALQITGSQTITMWIRPDRLDVRRHPIAKDYTGEGTIALEADGRLMYFFGPTGKRIPPYCYLSSAGRAQKVYYGGETNIETRGTKAYVKPREWTHIAIVRDLGARKLRWYVNGRFAVECDSPYPAAKSAGLSLFIGKGFASNFAGLIDEVGIWNRALTDEEVDEVCRHNRPSGPLTKKCININTKADKEAVATILSESKQLKALTEKLNRSDFWTAWTVKSGEWSLTKNGHIRGKGESRIEFNFELPKNFKFSFRMNVIKGMRPRIFLSTDDSAYFGNEGYKKTLWPYGNSLSSSQGVPAVYKNNQPLLVEIYYHEENFMFFVDGYFVAKGKKPKDLPVTLRLRGGDEWSKGTTEFWDFKIDRIEGGIPALKPSSTEGLIGGLGGKPFKDSPDGEGLLVGFHITQGKSGPHSFVKTLQPVFLYSDGTCEGSRHGKPSGPEQSVMAKKGYAVGAVAAVAGDRVDGFKIIFMKIKQDGLDHNDYYESKWFGGREGNELKKIGGDGRFVVGIHGRAGLDLICFGLILKNKLGSLTKMPSRDEYEELLKELKTYRSEESVGWKIAYNRIMKLDDKRVVDFLVKRLAYSRNKTQLIRQIVKRNPDAKAVAPQFLEILKDYNNSSVKEAAFVALKKIGVDEVEIVKVIFELLDEGIRSEFDRKVHGYLEQVANLSPEIIAPYLEDSKVSKRFLALSVMGPKAADKYFEKFIKLLDDESSKVVGEAIRVLGDSDNSRAFKPLVKMLKHERAYYAKSAATALGKLGDVKAISPLIDTANRRLNTSTSVKDAAKSGLSMIGAPAVKPLVMAWRAQDGRLYSTDLEYCFNKMGKPAVKPLISLLKFEDKMVREFSAKMLGKLQDRRAVDGLIIAIRDKDEAVSISAVTAITTLGGEKAFEAIVAISKHENPKVRAAAARGLGQMKKKEAIKPLAELIKDKDEAVSISAVTAVSTLGGEKACEALGAASKHENPTVRVAAARELGQMKKEEAIKPLAELIKDENKTVRNTAIISITALGGEKAFEAIVTASKHENPKVRVAAARGLGQMKKKKAFEPLAELIKDEDPDVRCSAVEALSKLDDKRTVDLFITALSDKSHSVQFAALRALKHYGRKFDNERIVEPLASALSIHDYRIRLEAAKALYYLGDGRGIDVIANNYIYEKDSARENLVWIAGNIKNKSIIGFLFEATKDPDQNVRIEAVKGLRGINWQPQNDTQKAYYLVAMGKFDDAFKLGEKATEAFVNSLRFQDQESRSAAAKKLLELGDSVKSQFLNILVKSKFEKRTAVWIVLEDMGWKPSSDKEMVYYHILHSNWDKAVELGEIALEPLLVAMQHGGGNNYARDALVKLGPVAVDPLIEALKDEHYGVRLLAAEALGRLGDNRAVMPLLEAMNDIHHKVRYEAGLSLVRFKDKRAIKPFAKLAEKDPSLLVMMAEFGPETVQYLVPALNNQNSKIRASAVKVLSKLAQRYSWGQSGQKDKAFELLLLALNDKTPKVRSMAAYAIGYFHDKRATEPLTKALGDKMSEVRSMAAWAIGNSHDKGAIEPLLKALGDKSIKVKSNAIHSLSRFDDEKVFEALKTMLNDEDSLVREVAKSVLENLETRKSVKKKKQ